MPGVGRVDVMASDVREIEVIADPARLAAQQLTYADLAAAIQAATTVEAVGTHAAGLSAVPHRDDDRGALGRRRREHRGEQGLRVGDLATVRSGTEDHTRVIAGDGRPAALLNITRQIGGNTLEIADSVARIAASLRKTLPPGLILKPVYDQASLVREAVTSVRDAMLIGAVLAVIILLLFLRHARITAISASSIPITMAITVFVMSLIGQTFNLMTLGAMAIAIGLVIDDAVVITENIVRHSHLQPRSTSGDSRRGAGADLAGHDVDDHDGRRLPAARACSTGVEGQFFHALSITLTIAVLVSLVVALTIIPLLSEQFLRAKRCRSRGEHATEPSRRREASEAARWRLDSLANGYERALGASLRHARWMLLIALALVGAGVLVHAYVPTGFLPGDRRGRVRVRLTTRPAAPRSPRPTASCTSSRRSSPRRRRSPARRGGSARSSGCSRRSRTAATSSRGSSRRVSATARPRR